MRCGTIALQRFFNDSFAWAPEPWSDAAMRAYLAGRLGKRGGALYSPRVRRALWRFRGRGRWIVGVRHADLPKQQHWLAYFSGRVWEDGQWLPAQLSSFGAWDLVCAFHVDATDAEWASPAKDDAHLL